MGIRRRQFVELCPDDAIRALDDLDAIKQSKKLTHVWVCFLDAYIHTCIDDLDVADELFGIEDDRSKYMELNLKRFRKTLKDHPTMWKEQNKGAIVHLSLPDIFPDGSDEYDWRFSETRPLFPMSKPNQGSYKMQPLNIYSYRKMCKQAVVKSDLDQDLYFRAMAILNCEYGRGVGEGFRRSSSTFSVFSKAEDLKQALRAKINGITKPVKSEQQFLDYVFSNKVETGKVETVSDKALLMRGKYFKEKIRSMPEFADDEYYAILAVLNQEFHRRGLYIPRTVDREYSGFDF